VPFVGVECGTLIACPSFEGRTIAFHEFECGALMRALPLRLSVDADCGQAGR
jgi:hypothetical protein